MDESLIINIVKKHCSTEANVTLASDLVHDLKIDGDDADELFEEMLSIKHIELPSNKLRRCFHSEGELLSWLYLPKLILYKMGLSSKVPLRELQPFTVNDLVLLFNAKVI